MSRLARKPLQIPAGVEIKENQGVFVIKGPKGELQHKKHPAVNIDIDGTQVKVTPVAGMAAAAAMVGTTQVLLGNSVHGVSKGFERSLKLVGVGYRAKVQGKNLELNLGFSHPVVYPIPEGVTIETPSQTDVIVKSISKEKVGQTAAEIRQYRPPESYKGKGVRYADEQVLLKETKKK